MIRGARFRMATNGVPFFQSNTSKPYHVESGTLLFDSHRPLIVSYKGMVGNFDSQFNPRVFGTLNVKEMGRRYRWAESNVPGFTSAHSLISDLRLIRSLQTNSLDLSELPIFSLASNLRSAYTMIPGASIKINEVGQRLQRLKHRTQSSNSFWESSKIVDEANSQISDINSELVFCALCATRGFDLRLEKTPDILLDGHSVEVKRVRGELSPAKRKYLEEKAFRQQKAEILAIDVGSQTLDRYQNRSQSARDAVNFSKAIKSALWSARRGRRAVILFGYEFWHQKANAKFVKPIAV